MSSPQPHKEQHAEVSFARSLGLFDATMLGIGGMIGAGVFVLTGTAVGEAGPAALLAFFLNGLITLCTILSFAELAGAIPEAGGGYSYLRRAFRPGIAFTGGWMQWFTYTVSGALFALGFGIFFWEVLHHFAPQYHDSLRPLLSWWKGSEVALVTALISIVFVVINCIGTHASGKLENVLASAKILVLAVFAGFGLHYVLSRPEATALAFSPFMPEGWSGVALAMGFTFVAFKGYDLVATMSEEIHRPERNVPLAMFLTGGICLVIYLLMVFVCIAAIPGADGVPGWQRIGQMGEKAVINSAAIFLPSAGMLLIFAGGMFSFTSALNAMLLASSRTAFSMGRDNMLPAFLSAIHPRRRTPQTAILMTGAILIAIVLSFDVAVIGSAASLMFLLRFMMVNAAALALRRDRSLTRTFRIPFFPWPPLLGVISTGFLALYQLKLGPKGQIAWAVCALWTLLGLAIYAIFFRSRVERGLPQVLRPYPEFAQGLRQASYRVMVQVYNPESVETLVSIGCRVARAQGADAEVVVAYIVEVPQQVEIREGLRYVEQAEAVLQPAYAVAEKLGVSLRTEIRVAHSVVEAILQIARQERVSLLVIGWRGRSMRREAILGGVVDDILGNSPCDLMVVRTTPAFSPSFGRILLPTAGGPSAKLAAKLAGALLAPEGELSLLSVQLKGEDGSAAKLPESSQQAAAANFAQAAAEVPPGITLRRELVSASSVLRGVQKQAKKGYDLIMVGSTREAWFRNVLLGEIPARIAKKSEIPVIIVKSHEGARTAVNRMLGGG